MLSGYFVPRIFSSTERPVGIIVRFFPSQDSIADSAAQHVAGDLPGQAVEGECDQTDDDQGNGGIQSFHHCSAYGVIIQTLYPEISFVDATRHLK